MHSTGEPSHADSLDKIPRPPGGSGSYESACVTLSPATRRNTLQWKAEDAAPKDASRQS